MIRDAKIKQLVSFASLAECSSRISDIVGGEESMVSPGTESPEALMALRNHLLFRDAKAVRLAGIEALNDDDLFYNQLYWFLRFVREYENSNGFNAGLHQQAFQLLERSGCKFDWSVVQQIYEYAGVEQ